MKKIISLMLCIVTICGLLNCTVIAESRITQDQITLLELTGVLDKEANWDEVITRGEFAQLVAKVAFSLNADPKGYVFNNGVVDVTEKSKYYNAVTALYNAGYLSADESGKFYPDDAITAEAAAEIIVKTLGYMDISLIENYTYFSLAMDKGIFKDVLYSNEGLTLYSAYIMIYNMLNCNITDLKNLDFDRSEKDIIYMSSRLLIHKVNGIVTEDEINSFYGPSNIDKGYLIIDNKLEVINDTGIENLFGLNITGYYVYNAEDKEYHLLKAYENTKNNKTILYSDSITDFSNRTYYYSDGYSKKDQEIKIPNNAVIVYNGKTVSLKDEFKKEQYKPKNGVVEIYDNDRDFMADIVFINEYETYVLELYSSETESLYFKDEKQLINLHDKKYKIYDKDGKKQDVKELKKNNVLMISKSIDGELYTILVSSYNQTEKVTLYNKDTVSSKHYVLTESGGRYNISNYVTENVHLSPIEAGKSYTFYFDYFDRIVRYERKASPDDWQIGYLVWFKALEDEKYGAKIYTTNGEFKVFFTNKRVRVIDENGDKDTYNPQVLLTELDYTGMIRYRLNANDLLNYIEIPQKAGVKPEVEDRLFCMVDTIKGESADNYYLKRNGNNINVGGAAIIAEKTEVFVVPDESEITDTSQYELGSALSLKVGRGVPVQVYGTNYKSSIAVCANVSNKIAAEAEITNQYPDTVASVELIYDDDLGKEVYEIKTLSSQGTENTYYMNPTEYETNAAPIAGSTSPVKISAGDIVYLSVSGDYIKKAVLAYDADLKVKGHYSDSSNPDVIGAIAGTKIASYSSVETLCSPFVCGKYTAGNTGNENSWKYYDSFNVRIFAGWVYSYSDGFMMITNQNPKKQGGYDHKLTLADGYLTETQYFTKSVALTVNDTGKKNAVEVKRAVEGDIRPYDIYGADCSRVVITQASADQRSITIINEN